MKKLFITIGLALAICFGFTAEAQAQCTVDGQMVPVINNSNLQDVAFATMRLVPTPNGPVTQRIIFINPGIMGQLQEVTQFWMLGHECAHHILHHELSGSHPVMREQEADCWSIRNMAAQDWFDEQVYRVLKNDLMTHWNPGDSQHFPMHVRVANLDKCLGR